MSYSCQFTNDNNVVVKLPLERHHKKCMVFSKRDNHEVGFRKINTWLINNKYTKDNIIDLGAWIGDNSVPWAMNLPESIIYSIDPSRRNLDFIKDVSLLNNIKNIDRLQYAVSDNVETITTNGNIDHCSFVYGNPNNNGKHKEYAVTLDSLWEDELIKNIGMIHLDVEGMEYRVLKGGNKMINKYRPIITYEQHLNIDDTKIIKGFLQEKKYDIFMIDEILPGCRSDCRNFLALPFDTALNKKIVNDINNYMGSCILV